MMLIVAIFLQAVGLFFAVGSGIDFESGERDTALATAVIAALLMLCALLIARYA